MPPKKQLYNFLLVGKTGSGKSSTGNTLLNKCYPLLDKSCTQLNCDGFKTSDGFDSCSSNIELKSSEFQDYRITVVDTPGLHDTNEKFTMAIIHEGMCRLKKGFDAILLVIKFGERLTQEMIDTIDATKTSFGELFVKQYCIIVFTFGDAFENLNNDNLAKWCKDEKKVQKDSIMGTLLKECGYRVVLFYNNKSEKREESLIKLLSYISSQTRYTNENFKKYADIRDEYVTRRGFPAQRAKIQEQYSLLENDLEDALNQNKITNLDDIKKRAEKLLTSARKAAAGTDKMNDLIKNVEDILERIKQCPKDEEGRKRELKAIYEQVKKQKAAGIAITVISVLTTVGGAIVGAGGAIVGAGGLLLANGAILATVAGASVAVVSAAGVAVGSYLIYKTINFAKNCKSRDNIPDQKTVKKKDQ